MRRDIRRHTRLVSLGWKVYRYTDIEIHTEPDRVVAEIAAAPASLRGEMTPGVL